MDSKGAAKQPANGHLPHDIRSLVVRTAANRSDDGERTTDSALDGLISAAISAFLVVLLAWRFILFPMEPLGNEELEDDDDEKSVRLSFGDEAAKALEMAAGRERPASSASNTPGSAADHSHRDVVNRLSTGCRRSTGESRSSNRGATVAEGEAEGSAVMKGVAIANCTTTDVASAAQLFFTSAPPSPNKASSRRPQATDGDDSRLLLLPPAAPPPPPPSASVADANKRSVLGQDSPDAFLLSDRRSDNKVRRRRTEEEAEERANKYNNNSTFLLSSTPTTTGGRAGTRVDNRPLVLPIPRTTAVIPATALTVANLKTTTDNARYAMTSMDEENTRSSAPPMTNGLSGDDDSEQADLFPDHNPTSLDALRRLLPCDDYYTVRIVSEETTIDEAVTTTIVDMAETDSVLSSERGPLPPYLDTITEEDTDDLMSICSERSSLKSPPSRRDVAHNSPAVSERNKKPSAEEQLVVEETANLSLIILSPTCSSSLSSSEEETGTSSNVGGRFLPCFTDDAHHIADALLLGHCSSGDDDKKRTTSSAEIRSSCLPPVLSTPNDVVHTDAEIDKTERKTDGVSPVPREKGTAEHNNNQPPLFSVLSPANGDIAQSTSSPCADKERCATGENHARLLLTAQPLSLVKQTTDDTVVGDSVRDNSDGNHSGTTTISTTTTANNNSSAPVLGLNDALREERLVKVYSDYFLQQTPTSSDDVTDQFDKTKTRMDIDLQKSMRRFKQNNQDYGDAPSSFVEDFKPQHLQESPTTEMEDAFGNRPSTRVVQSPTSPTSRIPVYKRPSVQPPKPPTSSPPPLIDDDDVTDGKAGDEPDMDGLKTVYSETSYTSGSSHRTTTTTTRTIKEVDQRISRHYGPSLLESERNEFRSSRSRSGPSSPSPPPRSDSAAKAAAAADENEQVKSKSLVAASLTTAGQSPPLPTATTTIASAARTTTTTTAASSYSAFTHNNNNYGSARKPTEIDSKPPPQLQRGSDATRGGDLSAVSSSVLIPRVDKTSTTGKTAVLPSSVFVAAPPRPTTAASALPITTTATSSSTRMNNTTLRQQQEKSSPPTTFVTSLVRRGESPERKRPTLIRRDDPTRTSLTRTKARTTPSPVRISPPVGAPWRNSKPDVSGASLSSSSNSARSPVVTTHAAPKLLDEAKSAQTPQFGAVEPPAKQPVTTTTMHSYGSSNYWSVKRTPAPSDIPVAAERKQQAKAYFGSSEHLQKLLEQEKQPIRYAPDPIYDVPPTTSSPLPTKSTPHSTPAAEQLRFRPAGSSDQRSGPTSSEKKSRHKGYFGSSDHLQKLLDDSTTTRPTPTPAVTLSPPSQSRAQRRKDYFGSSEHLQTLLKADDPSPPPRDKRNAMIFSSKDQLQFSADTYQAYQNSQPTPPARRPQPVLTEQNVTAWSQLPDNLPSAEQKLKKWRNSMQDLNHDESFGSQSMLVTTFNAVTPTASSHGDGQPRSTPATDPAKERIYQPRRLPDEEDSTFSRGSSRRSSKYRSKIEKARREFLQQSNQAQPTAETEPYRPPEVQHHRPSSADQHHRPAPPPPQPYVPAAPRDLRSHTADPSDSNIHPELDYRRRGPLLEKFHDSHWRSKVDISGLPPMEYGRAPESRYDNEYKRLVAEAEKRWAAYRLRLSTPNLYSHSRTTDGGYLETNVDDRHTTTVKTPVRVEETDLDFVHDTAASRRAADVPRSRADRPTERAASAADYYREETVRHQQRQEEEQYYEQQQQQREGRARTREDAQPTAHSRARSADYLMDQRAREELEPPENQLQKVLGESTTNNNQNISEHELRFRKSTEKLTVPDWYLNSEQVGSKYEGVSPTSPQRYYPAETPDTVFAVTPGGTFREGDLLGLDSAQSDYNQMKRYEEQYTRIHNSYTRLPADRKQHIEVGVPEKTNYKEQTWHYSGNLLGSVPRYVTSKSKEDLASGHHQQQPPPATANTNGRSKSALPPGSFNFDRYKTEVEDFKRSRESLHTISYQRYEQSNGVRSESVKQPQSQNRHNADSVKIRHVPVRKEPVKETNLDDDFDPSDTFVTSTPRNSDIMQRRPAPAEQQTPSYKPAPPPPQQQPQQQPQLQQQRQQQPTYYQQPQQQQQPQVVQQPSRPATLETRIVTQQTTRTVQEEQAYRQQHQGYLVSNIPDSWNQPRQRDSRVIEVADTFLGPRRVADPAGNVTTRFGGRVTIEEVLDQMLGLPIGEPRDPNADVSSGSLDTSLPNAAVTPTTVDGYSIFTENTLLMDRAVKNPEMAEEILKNEVLKVLCAYTGRIEELAEARRRGWVSCLHCYTYYCSRGARRADWYRHRDRCSFARVNTMCKEVIMKVREDPDAQYQMSQVGRHGYTTLGRGAVNIRFYSLEQAQVYLKGGWAALIQLPNHYLHFVTIPELVETRKEPGLISLCRRYDPRAKFIIFVSIVADIEDCPETPLLVHRQMLQQPQQQLQQPVQQPAYYQQQQPPARPDSRQSYGQHSQQSYQQYPGQSQPARPNSRQSYDTNYSYQQQQPPPQGYYQQPQQPAQQYEPAFTRTQSVPHSQRNKYRQQEQQPLQTAYVDRQHVLRSTENMAPTAMRQGQPVYDGRYL